jgi:hydroxypyruvate isomerase
VATFDVNLSVLFTELPMLERPAAARLAGFDAIEFRWPWEVASPSDSEVEAFVAAVHDAGVRLVSLNFFAGDVPGGDRGVLSWPGRDNEFRDSVDIAVGIGERLGCHSFNALYGNRLPGVSPQVQDELATANVRYAAEAVRRIDGVVLIEPLSGAPAYPLTTAADAIAVLDRVGAHNLRLLCDIYHLAVNGDDPATVIMTHFDRIGHVQFADAPGRHEPGTGALDFDAFLRQLDQLGYRNPIGLEYEPSGTTFDSLGWRVVRPR